MRNASYLFLILLTFLKIILMSQQSCQANTQLPQFHQTYIKMSLMKASAPNSHNPLNTFNYAVNYPIQFLMRSSSTNIGSLICIQKLDIANTGNSIHFKIRQRKSAISLLLTLEYGAMKWNDFGLNILLFNSLVYTNIMTGQLSVAHNDKSSIATSVSLPSTFKTVQVSTLAFISGIKMSLKNQNNFEYQLQLSQAIDINSKQYTIAINTGQNTLLSELNLNYIIFSQDSNYESYGSYATFTQIKSGEYSQYLSQAVSSNNYLFVGINSIIIKQGPSSLYFSFDVKEDGQNLLAINIKQPVNILKLGVFKIGNTPQNLCKGCVNEKVVQNYGSTIECVSLCNVGSIANTPNTNSVKCLKCPSELLYISNSQGGCSCQSGQTVKNGICQAQAINSVQNSDYLPTFTSLSFQCNDVNEYKNNLGQCVCKPGYIQHQDNGVNKCFALCQNGYYNGQTCVNCPEGTFPWNQVQVCFPCGNYCSICQSQFACKKCKPGFYANNQSQQCSQICGDGISATTQCDDGNAFSGDGCSSTCQIEDGYTCQQQLGGTKSVCSRQSLNIQRKSVGFMSGNLVIEYQISPPPAKQYSSDELSNIFGLKFLSAPPYQTYLVHNPLDLTNFRIVATYGGMVPLISILIQVNILMPNFTNGKYTETVTYNPITPRISFARRGNSQEDTLS